MKICKAFMLFATLLLSGNIAEAQGVFSIRGMRGDRSNAKIESRTRVVNITDLNSLKDLPYMAPEKSLDFRGIIAYNSVNYSNDKTTIDKGFYIWNGDKWITIYAGTPAGSLRGDLEALHAMQYHPSNNRYVNSVGYHKWDIDLEKIDNPKNRRLSGVFFREINGEQRVIEVSLDDFYFQNVTFTQGLEAVVAFKVQYSDKLKEINLKLPNLANFYSEQNESLISIDLDCPNLAVVHSKTNYKQSVLDISKCPNVFSLSVFHTRVINLNLLNNKKLLYLECSHNSLTNLNVSQNTKLINLSCHTNSLTELDISHNIALRKIICSKNKVAELDVSKNRELRMLECSLNELRELDMTNNRKLTELSCNYNLLKTLDLSKNVALTIVDCSINRSLTSIDVSNSLELNQLMCAECKLSSLDLSRQSKLETLDIYYTPLISIPKSIKICRNTLEKVIEDSYKGLHMSERESNIYDLIDCKP